MAQQERLLPSQWRARPSCTASTAAGSRRQSWCLPRHGPPGIAGRPGANRTAAGSAVEWMQGDMRAFDLGRTFDFVFITANSLPHLHEAEDLVSCFRSVRRHLAPGARFVFDVFNPSVRLLAEADGVRRTRESLSFMDPDGGNVSVDVAEIYDARRKLHAGRGTSRLTPSPTSSSHRSKSGASSRRSCRCSSRSAAFGSSSASATGPVGHLPWIRRFNSASASPRD